MCMLVPTLGINGVVLTTGVIDLNGRYFGGRVVRASFYNVDNFRALKLDNPTD